MIQTNLNKIFLILAIGLLLPMKSNSEYIDHVREIQCEYGKWGFRTTSCGLAGAKYDEQFGVFVDCKYDEIVGVDVHFISAKLDDKWGVVSCKDEPIIEFKYDDYVYIRREEIMPNGLGKATLVVNYKPAKIGFWGYKKGKVELIIECKYDWVEGFNEEGIARAYLNGRRLCINTKGEEVACQ